IACAPVSISTRQRSAFSGDVFSYPTGWLHTRTAQQIAPCAAVTPTRQDASWRCCQRVCKRSKPRLVSTRKCPLSGRSKEASERQFAAKKAERFVGTLESALDLHRRLGSDSDLVDEVSRLRETVQRLEAELREQDVDSRKRRALLAVNTHAGRLLPSLDVENADDPISLEINDLTIKVRGAERDDYLSEIGSGSNWLSYHLA